MWIVYALLSALFAALTSVLAKVGIEGINSNLATAIRTAVVLLLAWGIVFATGVHQQISSVSQKSWTFLVLSGLATGGSWLFFYKALQLGSASRVERTERSQRARPVFKRNGGGAEFDGAAGKVYYGHAKRGQRR